MEQGRPFVITIASEKGGVGKTTLATNLAVYLKALHEDLPVTIVSFDNHFTVDHMFAIGSRCGASVAALFQDVDPCAIARLGEYGVQFIPSERQLTPPDDDFFRLRTLLGSSSLGGVLIIDTRPVIDYFTRNALAVADLLLLPVKDRPSLVNVASLLEAYTAVEGDPSRAWLLPSLIDARLRLRNNIGMQAFLTFSGRERGYQVLDLCLAKSPKVESLTTGLSSRIYPVLTHARGTIVHQQFRRIAEFALSEMRRRSPPFLPQLVTSPGRRRHLQSDCPFCHRPISQGAHFWHDQRSRRRGFLHHSCLEELLGADLLQCWEEEGAALLQFDLDRVGIAGDAESAIICLFDTFADVLQRRPVHIVPLSPLEDFLVAMTGRSPGEFFREACFVNLQVLPLPQQLSDPLYSDFHRLRRKVLRQHSSDDLSVEGEFSC